MSRSTSAALIPLPPTSTPIASRRDPGSIGAPLRAGALSWSSWVAVPATISATSSVTASTVGLDGLGRPAIVLAIAHRIVVHRPSRPSHAIPIRSS